MAFVRLRLPNFFLFHSRFLLAMHCTLGILLSRFYTLDTESLKKS